MSTELTARNDVTIDSPWGPSQTVANYAPGIDFITTASHGGFRLSPERNAEMPASWRAAAFNGLGERGWYEEDYDWALVACHFPEVANQMSEENRDIARGIFADQFESALKAAWEAKNAA